MPRARWAEPRYDGEGCLELIETVLDGDAMSAGMRQVWFRDRLPGTWALLSLRDGPFTSRSVGRRGEGGYGFGGRRVGV